MYFYQAYGLGIHSDLQLPELKASHAPAQVIIRRDDENPFTSQLAEADSSCHGTAEELEVSWKAVGTFLVRGGQEVIVRPARGVEERVLRLFILGPVLALIFHQRGYLVLHASAVACEEGVAIFLGESGWGKSTVAAALHAQGMKMVADDFVPLDLISSCTPTVFPGYPRFKLWPDAAACLGLEPETMPRLHPQLEKRDHRIERGFLPTAQLLSRIYILGEGAVPEIVPLTCQQAFVELVRHSYANQLLHMTSAVARHFQQCGQLARRVPAFRLSRQRSLAALADVTQMVSDHLALAS